ncbi:MAG: WD40/YVTN/BNR-like repeat-containing protein, partial [Acidimicrobiales bacterium]
LLAATADGIRTLCDPSGSGDGTELGGHGVSAVIVDADRGAGATRRWALVDGRGVWLRSEGGDWSEVARLDDELTCLVPGPLGLLVGTAGAHLRRLPGATPTSSVEALGSFEHAPTRDEWYTPWGGPPDTRSLAVAGDGTIFVNVHVGGILRSTDGGQTWAATIDLHADVHQVLCPRRYQPDLVVAACADGLAVSHDAGATWRLREDGLRRTYCRAVAVTGDTVVVSASDGAKGSHAALYRAPVVGWGAFERCRRGLPSWFDGNVDTGWVATGEGGVAVATADGAVFVSTDEGATWDQAAGGLPRPGWLAWA